jgi:plasmid stabilization system protein ParE
VNALAPNVNVEVSRRANRQLAAAEAWWLRNRDKAPQAFGEEFARGVALICATPNTGKIVRTRSRPARRITLERIRYYIYYRVIGDRIRIISFWHTSRRPPRL